MSDLSCACGCGERLSKRVTEYMRGHRPRKPLAERLWPRTLRMPNGCLEWQGAQSQKSGHGVISRANGPGLMGVHRAAWLLTYGPIPDGMFVCHKCDNPPCVEPTHLFIGTAADNLADMAAKGRAHRPNGESNPAVKFTDAQIREMRALRAGGMLQREIAERFGTSQPHVSAVCAGQRRQTA